MTNIYRQIVTKLELTHDNYESDRLSTHFVTLPKCYIHKILSDFKNEKKNLKTTYDKYESVTLSLSKLRHLRHLIHVRKDKIYEYEY